MRDYKFTTHMLTTFTEMHGELLQEYFINDALVGKYMSASNLYHLIYPEAKEEDEYEKICKEAELEDGGDYAGNDEKDEFERESPKLAVFTNKYYALVEIANELFGDKMPQKLSLVKRFFADDFREVAMPKKSENTYWENMFVHAWISSQDRALSIKKKYYTTNKDDINNIIEYLIFHDLEWYKQSLWQNILWSIELFRLQVFTDNILGKQFDFTYILDWIDIFEYRIVPKVLERIMLEIYREDCDRKKLTQDEKKVFLAKKEIVVAGEKIYNYFIDCIRKSNDFPYAERFGVDKAPKEQLMEIRKYMLPLKYQSSDVNIVRDEVNPEKYYDEKGYLNMADIIKRKVGMPVTSSEGFKDLKQLTNERNKVRYCARSNGHSYAFLIDTSIIEAADAQVAESGLKLFAELTKNVDIKDRESVMENLLIYHMLQNELAAQKADDLVHPFLQQHKDELEKQYISYRKAVLEQVFDEYATDKRLQFDLATLDISDDLLAEMLMVDSASLSNDDADTVLGKVFEEEPNLADEERNEFINQAWGSFDVESKAIYALCYNGRMERIRGYIPENELSVEEKSYIDDVSKNWENEITKIHELLSNAD